LTIFCADDINATAKIQHVTKNLIVGNLYEIQCIVHTSEIVNSSIVNITWIGPNNGTIVTSRRINITDTTDGNNHTSILQFAYLSEKDKGLHICHVTILNSTVFDSITIEELLSELTKQFDTSYAYPRMTNECRLYFELVKCNKFLKNTPNNIMGLGRD